nr:cytochrome oxidase subunit III [Babesia vogeli]WVH46365.1 cytochrome oxidase subunit III [Babesia vogeli]WVH46366.1 cytochrome oxidase subunit III [Babesia vogeli]WVH46367.1 cytochrome oxidase subunit III [Babesia vogeli]WVH46368.1 cytochrome oxidase subunit III [Babesia vogeli]
MITYIEHNSLYATSLKATSLGEVFISSLLSTINSIREFITTNSSTLFAVYGMIIFSEAMLFFGFIWSYLHVRLGNVLIETPSNLEPFLNVTSTLNVGSVIVSFLLHKNISGENSESEKLIGILTLVGIAFISYQGDEYYLLQSYINGNWFTTLFLVITGLHSSHVCVGIILIMTSMFYYENEGSNKIEDMSLGTYWHFVEFIWVFLTLLLFIL